LVFFLASTLAWLRWGKTNKREDLLRTWLLALGVVNLAGVTIELTQHLVGRDASVSDLFLNNVGCVVALAFGTRCQAPTAGWRIPVLRGAALALLAWALVPLYAALSDEYSAARAFPVLADFETPFQLSRWESDVELSVERVHVRFGEGAMRVPLSTDLYSTAGLRYFRGDWSGANSLAFCIYNPDPEPLELVLRVHDEWHDKHGQSYDERFNRAFTVENGWNDILVPISDIEAGPRNRRLNIRQIRGLSIFSVELPSPRTIVIDQLELR
jgi:hypothetical protein